MQRYPLTWPAGWARTLSGRKAANFSKRKTTHHRNDTTGATWTKTHTESLTIGDGLERLEGELKRLGARDVIISSNLRLRQDGFPLANQAAMLADPGIAVYFTIGGKKTVLACDRWRSAADNMAAIAGHIDAIRMQQRYGVGTLEQAFAGFAQLPAPVAVDPWPVLGISPTRDRDEIERAYHKWARTLHPDAGGNPDAMAQLNIARDAALATL